MVKRDSSLQGMHFHCFRVKWWRVLHHSSQRLALLIVILDLCTAARPWKPNSWSSWQTVIVLTLLPEAVRNSVVSVATKDRWFLHAKRFSTRWSRSVSLWVLPLRGWAVVVSRRFYVIITALTVDRGSSSRVEIWLTDLLERWHPMTVPR
jgi:hypothetical protein